MRNIDRIRQMSLEELAPLLVKDETIEFNDLCYSSPSGNKFYDEDGAVHVKFRIYPKCETVRFVCNENKDFRRDEP